MWWPKTWRDLKQRKRLIENKIERDRPNKTGVVCIIAVGTIDFTIKLTDSSLEILSLK